MSITIIINKKTLLIFLFYLSIVKCIIPTSIKVNIGMFPLPNGGGMPSTGPSCPPSPSTTSSSSIIPFRVDPVMVKQLVVGSLHQIQQGASMTASVSLIHDNGYFLVVDTPSATDLPAKEQMLRGFTAANIYPGQVQMVLTTHGHPDHTGQGNFFPNSRHFFASYEYTGNNYIKTELYNADEMKITQNIELWNTPGHTNQDVSAIVRNTLCGTIAVVGDLFYSEADAAGNSTEWRNDAWNPEIGDRYRAKVICAANCIVPGHGPVFSVTEDMRRRFNCSGNITPGTTLGSTTAPTTSMPFIPPSTTTLLSTTTLPDTTTTPMPAVPSTTTQAYTEVTPQVMITLPPPAPSTQGYATVDYPTPPPYVDINGNQIDDSPQSDTILTPSTIVPPTTPSPYVTVDHWQMRPQAEEIPPGSISSGVVPNLVAQPHPVPNGLYSVPAGIMQPIAAQPMTAPCPNPALQQFFVPPQAAAHPTSDFIQHFPAYPLKNAFSPPGAIILPMVESAANNLVNYLNAPQMQPPCPQPPVQAGYFELIKRAFHKFTDQKSIGALVVNKKMGS